MTYNQLTTDSFIEKARKIHGVKYDYSKVDYINNHTKIHIICPVHGEFLTIPMKHLAGHECPECAKTFRGLHKKLDTATFISKAQKVHGCKYDYSKVKYMNSATKVCIICPEHGEFWITPNNHLRGHGCSKCNYDKLSGLFAKNTKEFIEDARKIHGDKYDYSEVHYVNNKTKVCIICPTHGKFWITPHDHLSGNGCHKCSDSKLERDIAMLLDENGITYKQQASSKDIPSIGRQRLDFYLPEFNIAIECQGEQHFKPVDFAKRGKKWAEQQLEINIKRDNKKLEICSKNGIKILYYSNLHINYPYNVFEDKTKLLNEIRGTNA